MGWIYDLDAPPEGSAQDRTALLGGKGAGLVVMAHELGLPVPPAFVVTTEACRYYLAGAWPEGLDEELRQQMERLGEKVGRRFGDEADPLLVSVRSGAPVSMPGMMDTVLNLGLTATTADGFAKAMGSADFAADCRRRLAQGWRSVIGGGSPPDDVWAQLRAAVEAVFRSWNSDRAKAYREREDIGEELGTAVTVQAMVFGNRAGDSGTGVLFTRNPSTGERGLYGDFMFNAQGEDVVAGTHETTQLSVLRERLPNVASELDHYADLLERHLADLADIEFTVENGRLWLLQVRAGKRSPQAALRMAIDMAEEPGFPLSREQAVQRVLRLMQNAPRTFVFEGMPPAAATVGLPASPGVASGAIALTSESAEQMADAGQSVILVRSETSPEDVRGMAKSVGVLTARGGLASHAAVVARGWGIPAVVGATAVEPAEDHITVAERRLAAGDRITIDGSTGNVYLGEVAGRWETAPEAATLLGWAKELGIDVTGEKSGPVAAGAGAAASRDDVLVGLSIKGTTPPDKLAEALMVESSALEPVIDELARDGLVERLDADVRLTAAGKAAASSSIERDRSAAGDAGALLDEFHGFDGRMKELVTAWQMRVIDGEQTFNDHSDAAYDASVLSDLAELHEGAAAWLQPIASRIGRYSTYRSRLDRALGAAQSGDQRFVASPRVDSYHSVWFELHEDLIRIAGRVRTE